MRKRVLFFRPNLVQGGADRVTITLLREISKEKYDIELCLIHGDGDLIDEVPSDIRIHVLNCKKLVKATGPLRRILEKRKPDVLFSTCSGANIPAVLARETSRHRTRLVLSERSALIRHPLSVSRVVLPLLKMALYPKADLLTAVSEGVRSDLLQHLNLCPEKTTTVGNPIVSEKAIAMGLEGVDHPWFEKAFGEKIIVSMGRLVPEKDHRMLLDAFSRIVKTVPNARLAILGDGPERASLEAAVNASSFSQHVHFFGFQKNPFRFLSKSDLFALTSWTEGLPGALIQGMSLGLPAISTNCHAGPAEVIDDPGNNGYLVPVGDAHSFSRIAVDLLKNKALADQIGAAGKRTVERYSVRRTVLNYEAAIDFSLVAAS